MNETRLETLPPACDILRVHWLMRTHKLYTGSVAASFNARKSIHTYLNRAIIENSVVIIIYASYPFDFLKYLIGSTQKNSGFCIQTLPTLNF